MFVFVWNTVTHRHSLKYNFRKTNKKFRLWTHVENQDNTSIKADSPI